MAPGSKPESNPFQKKHFQAFSDNSPEHFNFFEEQAPLSSRFAPKIERDSGGTALGRGSCEIYTDCAQKSLDFGELFDGHKHHTFLMSYHLQKGTTGQWLNIFSSMLDASLVIKHHSVKLPKSFVPSLFT